MKIVFRITIVLVVALLCAVASPWLYWNFSVPNILGYNPPDKVAGLQVSSISGKLFVLIDDEQIGEVTPDSSPFEYTEITPGQHKLTLKRESNPSDFYPDFNKVIDFAAGVNTVVGYEIGPNVALSEGHILIPIKNNTNQTNLIIKAEPANAKVFIDTAEANKDAPMTISTENPLSIKVEAVGYEPLQFTILPSSSEDRKKLNGFDLELVVKLMQIPVELGIK